MFLLLLIAITLGSSYVVHGLLSLAAVPLWHFNRKRLEQTSPRRASQYLFWLRVAPSVVTLIAAAVFIIPAFLKYEPRSTAEPVSISLAILAGIALLIVCGGLRRSFSAILQSNRIMKSWMENAQEQKAGVGGASVYRCKLDLPVIAVLGLWRTRIFVSDQVFEVLTAEELDAALRHEAVHANSRDTLKKLALHFAPNIFPAVDLLKPIRESWAKACELSADEEAVCHAHGTLSLASAIVKVARLSCTAEMPTLSAALMDDGQDFLGYRVERLLQISEAGASPLVASNSGRFKRGLALCAGMLMLVVAAYPQALSVTHELLELFVRSW